MQPQSPDESAVSATNLETIARELHALRTEVHTLRHIAKRSTSQMRLMLGFVTLAAVGGAMTAGAQVVTDSLKTLVSGQPAKAADVNFNFLLLKKWIEHKVGTATTPAVTMTSGATISGFTDIKDAMRFDCDGCGSATVMQGTENYGDLVVQGRVLSANNNIHLSPPGGLNVVIEDSYRGAGGTKTGAGAGLTVQGGAYVGGDFQAPNNTSTGAWRAEVNKNNAGGATVGQGGVPATNTWAVQECPSGQFVCGIAFTHPSGGNETYQERYTIRCCTL